MAVDATGNEYLLQQWTSDKSKYTTAWMIAKIDLGNVTTFHQVKQLNPKMSFYHEKKLRSRLKQAAQQREDEAPRPDCVLLQLLKPVLN